MFIDPDFVCSHLQLSIEISGAKYNVVKKFAGTSLEKAKAAFNKHIQININPTPTSKPKKKTLKK